jgi:carbonic anhydrase/acetyltransferase-like protein (isoleucine patch superfamily)
VGIGAIVASGEEQIYQPGLSREFDLLSEPLGHFEVLGRSTLERIIERFVRAELEVVAVLRRTGGEISNVPTPSFTAFENVEYCLVNDDGSGIQQKLRDFSRAGIDHAFVLFGNLYAETDLLDVYYFHREARQVATRTVNREGLLDLWVLDCAKAQDLDLKDVLKLQDPRENSYFIREYVKQVTHPRDLRHFASDLLQGRCSARPAGREVKRGIWLDDGAEVHRRARIVAPAYVGRESKVMEDALITRCSNVERQSCIDYGSVIEDSSILQNTEIGICLDVCHAVANGNRLLNLDRNVVIEISDANVMRSNRPAQKPAKERKWARNVSLFSSRRQEKQAADDLQPAAQRQSHAG